MTTLTPHPVLGPYTRTLPDGRIAYVDEMTLGKGRLNVSSLGCIWSIDIGF